LIAAARSAGPARSAASPALSACRRGSRRSLAVALILRGALLVARRHGQPLEDPRRAHDRRALGRPQRDFYYFEPEPRGVRIVDAAVRAAGQVIQQGINMTIYVEGRRSFDGRLLPFKKGPFYLATECNVPVVPVTIAGSHYVMPKQRFAIRPATVTVTFHDPIEPKDFGGRECLMVKVRNAINSALPAEFQQPDLQTAKDLTGQQGVV